MSTAATQTYDMTIAGEGVAAVDTFGVINPATGEVFDHAPECSRAQLDSRDGGSRASLSSLAAQRVGTARGTTGLRGCGQRRT